MRFAHGRSPFLGAMSRRRRRRALRLRSRCRGHRRVCRSPRRRLALRCRGRLRSLRSLLDLRFSHGLPRGRSRRQRAAGQARVALGGDAREKLASLPRRIEADPVSIRDHLAADVRLVAGIPADDLEDVAAVGEERPCRRRELEIPQACDVVEHTDDFARGRSLGARRIAGENALRARERIAKRIAAAGLRCFDGGAQLAAERCARRRLHVEARVANRSLLFRRETRRRLLGEPLFAFSGD